MTPGAVPPDGADCDALIQELELELLHLAQIQALLDEEQRELMAGRTERLAPLAAEKVVQLRALELYGERVARLLADRGHAANRDGMLAVAAAAPAAAGETLRRLWLRLAEAAGHARDANEQNGTLIGMRLAMIGGRLAHLAGAPATAVYSAAGFLQPPGAARTLGRY